MCTVKGFFSTMLNLLELGHVSRRNNLHPYNGLNQESPSHYIIFLALDSCWKWLKAKRDDPDWLNQEITPAEARFILRRATKLFMIRMHDGLAERDWGDLNGQLHYDQANRALEIFEKEFYKVCDHYHIVFWPKVKIDFHLL